MVTPRGIRNNNPGNVRRSNDQWQGLAAVQSDPDFFSFEGPEWGIRAVARILITYQDKRKAADGSKIDTVDELIGRWAPANENDTAAYVADVRRFVDSDTIDVHRYDDARPIVEAIIRHENGEQPYDATTINRGLELAGIEVPKDVAKATLDEARPLASTRTVQATQLAGVAGTAAVVVSQVQPVIDAATPFAPMLNSVVDKAPWILLAIMVIGLGVVAYARWSDRQEAKR